MASYYDYQELRAAANSGIAEDINALGDWMIQYGSRYWNGEYYDIDNGDRLFPVHEKRGEDDYEIVGWEIR